jgi:hypothetical protein
MESLYTAVRLRPQDESSSLLNDEPLCPASALWESIRGDDLFEIGSSRTRGTVKVACGKAGRTLVVLEIVGCVPRWHRPDMLCVTVAA